jgi:hypothetical protein
MAIDDAVWDVGSEVGHSADGDSHFYSFIGRGDPIRRRAAAANSSDTDPLRIDLRAGSKVINATNSVPALNTCWCIAARNPPPSAFAICAVMSAGNFAQLKRVDDQADIPVPSEPNPVGLIRRLVSITSAVRMATYIKDGWEMFAGIDACWTV